ncbi:MAG: hypothetical protein GX032_01565 [Tenericutes bacterium]|nr:hypothetical protein [Mycoplasmatota bacterium]
MIVNLIGLCDYGEAKLDLVDNIFHKSKVLFKHFTWHSDIPLFSDDTILNIDRIKIKKWLMKINAPLYNVRGNIEDILIKIKEIIND